MSLDIELVERLKELRNLGQTYEFIGEKIGISGGLVWKVLNGECTSHKARHYFGLPPKVIEIAPCSGCGGLHVKKTCSNKPRRKQYRISLQFESQIELEKFRSDLETRGRNRIEQTKDIIDVLEVCEILLTEKS